MNIRNCSILFILTLFFFSCDKQAQFTVSGTVEGAKGDTLYLEKRGFSDITVVDSVVVEGDGSFSLKASAPKSPDLYLLRLGNRLINLSVDSTDVITVRSTKKEFGVNYQVEGSQGSAMMKEIVDYHRSLEDAINALNKKHGDKSISDEQYVADYQTSLSSYKTAVKKTIIKDLKSPAAYFGVFQKLNDALIFDPNLREDAKIYLAVATSWDLYYKDSDRSKHLREFSLSSMDKIRRNENAVTKLEQASYIEESSYYKIELPNIDGKQIALSSLKGKPVLLDFTSYQTEYSPMHNMLINKMYQKYKGKLEVYQVSFDSDAHSWKNAAVNLPWICVRDPQSVSSSLIQRFNIQAIPTSYLLNAKGEIIKKITEEDDLDKQLKSLL